MPYMSNRYPHPIVPEGTRGAFEVPEHVAEQWAAYLVDFNGAQPRNWRGHNVRPYPAMDVPVHPPYAPAGIYTDHRDTHVEQAAYDLRDRVTSATGQQTLAPLAVQFGLRHWRDAYNTVRNVGRRRTGENGRDTNGDLRWRRWNTTWATHRDATGAVQAESQYRQFGIELEYGCDSHYRTSPEGRAHIVEQARLAGVLFYENWNSWNLDPQYPRHWQACYDSTVTGSEIVSPIMDGDDASHNEVRDMIRWIREAGGHASPSQGLHVHHNASDFTQAERSRLVRNLRAVERAMGAYVYQPRTTGRVSCSAAYTPDYEWDQFTAHVDAGRTPHSHGYRYRFFNLEHFTPGTGCRIEFRGMGNSLNAAKIRTWVRMGQAVMAATKAGHEFPANCTTEQLIDGCQTHGNLSDWAATKWRNRVTSASLATV